MRQANRSLLAALACIALAIATFPRVAAAQDSEPPGCCTVPDNGGGTANHPPACPNGYSGQMHIINGLPPGTTVDIAAIIANFAGLLQVPGGTLGGNKENWTATAPLALTGTGTLLGYNRNINLPISAGETHSAPRIPFAPSQSFNTVLFMMQGQIAGPGDPDFDLLRITAGTGFGLPSPGHTIFTQSGSNWAVDSFFDITYRIDFVGHPGGPFGGMSGSTTGTYRFSMCHDDATPARHSTWGAVKAYYR
jgi:hypothetical protein